MMEQPSCKEDNAEEKRAVSPDNTRQHSDPSHGHDPDPKAGVIADFNANNTVDVDLNEEKTNNNAEEKNKSSAGVSKTKKSVRWSQELVMESPVPRDYDHGSKYVNYPSNYSSSFNFKDTIGSVKDVLGRWGKKVGETTRKAEDLVGNTWQHLKTSPSLADATLGRIAQGTKILAEGGYEKIFRQTFKSVPEEQLKDSYACYLSTSAGPVMGVLYVSTAKLAFCSDNPLSYNGDDKMEWSYYKVVIPLHQLKAVNPSSSRTNPAEKYIQIISADNHEFWFMGFLNYTGAVNCLQESLEAHNVHNM